MTEYPLFAKHINVEFNCPNCNQTITHQIDGLPSPNWDGDTIETSQREESYDFACKHCNLPFEIDVFANIYYGELRVHKLNDWREIKDVKVTEYVEKQDQHRAITDMRTDLDIFLMQGSEFRQHLENLALYACYWSKQTNTPFAVENILEDKDDYRYDYIRGRLSAICSSPVNEHVRCIKVSPTSKVDCRTYFACNDIKLDYLIEAGLDFNKVSSSMDYQRIYNYFKANMYEGYFPLSESSVTQFDIMQTSLNDDILLYFLKCANGKKINNLPFNLLTTTTPYYSIVEAYGFSECLKKRINENYSCDFDTTKNSIRDIRIGDTFRDYTIDALTNKYESYNMLMEDLFNHIKNVIAEYGKFISKL